MQKGKVKWFNQEKGFGFIAGENGTDYFVHYTGIAGYGFKALEVDQQVEFEVAQGDRGPKAVNVEKL